MSEKQQVFQWLDDHADEIRQFLSSLIQIPSVSGQEYNVQQKIKQSLEEAGMVTVARAYDAQGIRPNVLGTYKGTGGGESLLLVAHSDTVAPGDSSLWDHDPFSGDFDGKHIYGRGAADDKWGITSAFFALKALKECGIKLSGDVHMLSSVSEETSFADRRDIGAGAMVRDMEVKPSFGIICEGADMEICVETPLGLSFELTVKGKAGHPCGRNRGIYPQPFRVFSAGSRANVDALQKAMLVIDALYRLERDLSLNYTRGGLLGSGGTDYVNRKGVGAFTICPLSIIGGTGSSSIGDVTVKYFAQFPGTYTHQEVFDIIRQAVDAVADSDLWMREHRPEVKMLNEAHGFRTDSSLPAIATMQKSFEDAMGTPGVVANWIAQCDGDAISPYVPCVIFGPYPPGAHAPNERITPKELVDCAKVFASTAMDHCK